MKTCAQYQREYRERRKAKGLAESDHQRAMEYQRAYRQKQKELATLQKTKTPNAEHQLTFRATHADAEQKARHAQQQRIYVKRKLAEGIDVNHLQNQKRQKEKNLDDQLPRIYIPDSEEQAGLDRITQAHLQQMKAIEDEKARVLSTFKAPPAPLDINDDIQNSNDDDTFN